MNPIYRFLSDVPLASVITVLTAVGALYSLVVGEITYVEFAGAVAAVSAGSGVLGFARNGAGHGVRRNNK
jgi:hypothetical protein